MKDNEFLSDYTDNKWDHHKSSTEKISYFYLSSPKIKHKKFAERMNTCADFLQFSMSESGTNLKLKLTKAKFCRVRLCPVCMWRRSLFWRARLFQKLPILLSEQKNLSFIFLTLTVKNCYIGDLSETLKSMNLAWNRLRLRKEFKIFKGFIRATEVTKSRDGSAHPHFHVILAVNSSYFNSRYFVSTSEWSRLWGECLGVDYFPVVDCRKIRKSGNSIDSKAVIETLKYTTKIKDLLDDKNWFLSLTDQLYKKRFLATGGCFKNLLKEEVTSDEMSDIPEEDFLEEGKKLFFEWESYSNKYKKVKKGN